MPTAYCPSCRRHFRTAANPPYAAIHVNGKKEGDEPQHLHAITREVLRPALAPEVEAMLADPAVLAAAAFDLAAAVSTVLEEAPHGFSAKASVWCDGVRRALEVMREEFSK